MRKYRPLFSLALLCLFPAATQAAEPFRFPEARDGKAELKYVNGTPVLTVGGTPEEMGRAVGTLAVKPGARVLEYPRDLLRIFSAERVMDWFVKGVESAA